MNPVARAPTRSNRFSRRPAPRVGGSEPLPERHQGRADAAFGARRHMPGQEVVDRGEEVGVQLADPDGAGSLGVAPLERGQDRGRLVGAGIAETRSQNARSRGAPLHHPRSSSTCSARSWVANSRACAHHQTSASGVRPEIPGDQRDLGAATDQDRVPRGERRARPVQQRLEGRDTCHDGGGDV